MIYLIKLDELNRVVECNHCSDFINVPVLERLSSAYLLSPTEIPLGHAFVAGNFVPPPRKRWLTVRGFRERMTPGENQRAEMLILSASRTDATQQQMEIAGSIAALNRMLSDSSYVDLDYPMTRAGVEQLALIPGLLDHENRVAEILDGEILEGQYHPDA